MSLIVTSVIPVELFTLARREAALRACALEEVGPESIDARFITEIGGSDCRVYRLSTDTQPTLAPLLVAQESSLCFVLRQEKPDFTLCESDIRAELEARNNWHNRLIRDVGSVDVRRTLERIRAALDLSPFGRPEIHYVFSFYTLLDKGDHASTGADERLLKVLAEPSLLDMDDMLSSDLATVDSPTGIKPEFLEEIRDHDISGTSRTYITWATIATFCRRCDSERNIALLTALECRLQMVWNRCYAVSRFIDTVFRQKTSLRDVSELYWSFVRTLDDARAVISSTFSSRANRLFTEMVRTSRIEGEIARLAQKLDLLEKYVEQRNQRQNRIYQKSIELLLFVTAIAAVMQVLFPLPFPGIPMTLGVAIVVVLGALGTYLIFKAR